MDDLDYPGLARSLRRERQRTRATSRMVVVGRSVLTIVQAMDKRSRQSGQKTRRRTTVATRRR